jgi:hypothetical protein
MSDYLERWHSPDVGPHVAAFRERLARIAAGIDRERMRPEIEPNFPEITPRLENRVYESMTRVQAGRFSVRVWREEKCLEPQSNDDLRAALEAAPLDATAPDLIAIAEALPRVVAVEVLDDDGNGILLYPDWN